MTSEQLDKLLDQIERYGDLIVTASQSWHDYNCCQTDKKPPIALDYHFRTSSGYLTAAREFLSSLPQNAEGVRLFKAFRNSVAALFNKLGGMGYGIFGQEVIAHFYLEVNADVFARETKSHVTTTNLLIISEKYQAELARRFSSIANQLKKIIKSNERIHEFSTSERTWDNPFFARVLKDAENHTSFPLTNHCAKFVESLNLQDGTITLRSGQTLSASPKATTVWAVIRLLLGYSDKYGHVQLPCKWEKAFEHRPGHFTKAAQGLYQIRRLILPRYRATKSNKGWYKINQRG